MTQVTIKRIGETDYIVLSDTIAYDPFWGVFKPPCVPAYEVRAVFAAAFGGTEPIVIKKTTLEENQKQICAAVKSIEEQLLKLKEEQAELQRLADGCK
jgi:hypothetical protein